MGWECCRAEFELPLSGESGAGDMHTRAQAISAVPQLPGTTITLC